VRSELSISVNRTFSLGVTAEALQAKKDRRGHPHQPFFFSENNAK